MNNAVESYQKNVKLLSHVLKWLQSKFFLLKLMSYSTLTWYHVLPSQNKLRIPDSDYVS